MFKKFETNVKVFDGEDFEVLVNVEYSPSSSDQDASIEVLDAIWMHNMQRLDNRDIGRLGINNENNDILCDAEEEYMRIRERKPDLNDFLNI